MKKVLTIIFVFCFFAATEAADPSSMIITLKDGSTIQGKIVDVNGNQYIIETESMGNVEVDTEEILSMVTPGSKSQTTSLANPLQQNVRSIQGQIMRDEEIMESIETLSQDEEMMKLLQDPELMQAVMSFDEEKIKNNPVIQQLLQRDDIQQIMGDIQDKLDLEAEP